MAGFCGSQVDLTVLLFSLVLFSCYHAGRSEDTNIVLDENNWTQISEGEWMIKFFAPWCPACRGVGPTWQAFAKHSSDLGIKVAEVDVTKSPEVSGRFMISTLPTFYHAHNGKFRKYPGGRSIQDFMSFVKEKKWEDIEPISSWKSPTSITMTWMGYMIKLSTYLRDAHLVLTESYGLPSWGSYAVFGVATVAVGLLLGLVIVVITEIVYRSERRGPPPPLAEPMAEEEAEEPAETPISPEDQQPDEAQPEDGGAEDDVTKQDDEDDEDEQGEQGVDGGQEDAAEEDDADDADQQEEEGGGEKLGDEEPEEENDESPREVDEIIEDKVEEEDIEHTEVRHRKPVAADDD